MKKEDFKLLQTMIPEQPGIYKFLDAKGEIIYVGKAKNLLKRTTSYFTDSKGHSFKTITMVKHAVHLEYLVVETEHDALLLESTLIKKNQPRYNVNLKDGKSYAFICIKKERFPRIFFTRKIYRDGSEYFGPYTSKYKAEIILDFLKTIFPLRNCTLQLSEENITKNKFKVCLEYHIKNCLGPCEAFETEEDYSSRIKQIRNILNGNFGDAKSFLKSQMEVHAEDLDFEAAQAYKIRLDAFDDYQSKSMVVHHSIGDVDVFSIDIDEKEATVNYLRIIKGALINAHTFELEKNLDEDPETLLAYAVLECRDTFSSIANEIITPFKIDLDDEHIKITVPQRGDKKKLLELSQKNLRYYILQKKSEIATNSTKPLATQRILSTLRMDLHMDKDPEYIECFDNSNIQGSHPVAACVVFKNAKPSKNDYRHYNVKTVDGPNDFASMSEIVYRRYRRLIEEEKPIPDLIVIDGGKGQLSAAMESIEKLGLQDQVKVIGIAKRLEEIYFPNDPVPLYIDKKSESLKVIQKIRNEAHRFAISFHRDQRSRAFLTTGLTDIPGIAKKSAETLLKHFGSMARVQEAAVTDLSPVIGNKKAEVIFKYFHPDFSEEE
ncbi:MAG: excinuclease ABC subunit C [Saprospiraceae bacterium]|jgi:excinuclease ABC subunit C|nr:excinuclease ABC subunit C [Saprospiraceae bacterium]MBK7437633.1 excinuclease ABC subunit C [Saprospiraceae bacterium]MBK8512315.1 excinuclease ABC subunit C [Saprospiraceae bacterium]MBP7801017.1 excinuclease ABC subunit C [Saprospiraceae bacterium]MBP8095069.1 excinuclease ABC subunit C [Saprospiraceae bacterium]